MFILYNVVIAIMQNVFTWFGLCGICDLTKKTLCSQGYQEALLYWRPDGHLEIVLDKDREKIWTRCTSHLIFRNLFTRNCKNLCKDKMKRFVFALTSHAMLFWSRKPIRCSGQWKSSQICSRATEEPSWPATSQNSKLLSAPFHQSGLTWKIVCLNARTHRHSQLSESVPLRWEH